MNFGKVLQIVASLPTIIQTVESIKGKTDGAVKRDDVKTAVLGSTATMQALGQLQVRDQKKFNGGLDKVIDGIVQMLNASSWN